MLDAYTVRKAVPRLVIAVIAINISIYLCVAALDIAIIVGKGINQLLVTPFVNSTTFEGVVEANAEGSIVGVAGAGILGGLTVLIFKMGVAGAVGTEILALLLPLVITVALLALAVLFTLVIWQALVIFLTVISPIAFACYVLPGTEKYFRQWWDLYVRTLVVFPLIAVFFAMSNVMAAVLFNAASTSPDGIGLLQYFATIVVVFAPLVLIPFAFKMSGGLISQVAQFAGGQASGLSRRAGQAYRQSRKDPSTLLGRNANALRSARTEKGFTANQLWASRPGKNRSTRMSAAQLIDRKKIQAASSEDFRAKVGAQDSDVQDAMLMTSEQARVDRDKIKGKMADATTAHGSGLLSDREYEDTMRMYQNKLQGHDMADAIGRTAANRQAAFFSADRIKFTENDHEEEMALARDIFGEAGMADAMNEHQAVAKGAAGRPDLAASLYGARGDLDKASEHVGMYQLMNSGRPAAIKSLVKQHIARMEDPSADPEAKRRSAAFLHTVKEAKGQGTPANNRAINELLKSKPGQTGIDDVLESHIKDETAKIIASPEAPLKGTRRVDVTKGVSQTHGIAGGATVPAPIDAQTVAREETRSEVEEYVLTAAEQEAEARRMAIRQLQERSQAYRTPDPSERETP